MNKLNYGNIQIYEIYVNFRYKLFKNVFNYNLFKM